MPLYIVYYEGRGEGCDYTIGCNSRVRQVTADTSEQALEQVASSLREEGLSYIEERYQLITVFEVKQIVGFDLSSLVAAMKREARCSAATSQEERERLEYERLHAKFGSS